MSRPRPIGSQSTAFREPTARTHQLVTNEVGGEVMVYDLARHHLHRLNDVSATVWRLCDGRRTVHELARESGLPMETVRAAVGQLASAELLDGASAAGSTIPGQSRRSFLRKAAVAGAAVPLITSITAPSAAANHSQGQCIPHLSDVPGADTAHHPDCKHCCRPNGGDGFCYFVDVFPFGMWRCWGQ